MEILIFFHCNEYIDLKIDPRKNLIVSTMAADICNITCADARNETGLDNFANATVHQTRTLANANREIQRNYFWPPT